MAMHDEQERRLIELEYGPADELLSVRSEKVRIDRLSPADLARSEAGAENIRQRRLAQAQAVGKIGRNEPCPCGSGQKYKHCCRL
jgi:preprotein translocase subunit SecA